MASDETGGFLRWAVRESLQRYVTVISRGTITVDGGATVDDDGVFAFPVREVVRGDGEWAVSCGGAVRLTAHNGLLDIRIAEPEFVLGAVGGIVLARTDDHGTIIPVAATPPVDAVQTAEGLAWAGVPAELLETAVELFGGVYPAGTELAPLTISVPRGISVRHE
ncbi:HtaA domain-containing protein [Herbiconiux daphne]|uniref:HtaA domain-containing protein n=1 Tax=Herbiconiux daphne TaxID=2970914 RepID=A0ABT2H7Y7_9MICO|nr:HtaA domain-containing protein [Herbiconiux daphne]MCS5736075.1 HtaA domain-containing protein [Herbiconiux daphne]